MRLGDVMTLSKGNLISIDDDKEYVIAGVQNYGAGILNKRKVKGIELTMKKYQLIKSNQLMWCKVDTKNGAFGITKVEHENSLASTNMALANIDTSKCYPEFIEYLFRISFFHETITKASSGTTNRKYLTPTQLLENIEIPDFNKKEQLKWLKKVDSINNSGILIELSHQLDLVKKLRQQLLQDAIQGRLVEQNEDDEPASELLNKICLEREKLVKLKKTKKDYPLHKKSKKIPPFVLPQSWEWVRFSNIAWCFRGHNPPKYQFIKTPKEGYVRFVQITDFKTNSNAVYVPESKHLKLVQKGEILMAAYRHIGKFSREMEGAFNVALCKINNIEPFDRNFLGLVIKSDLITGELLSASERGHIPSMHTEHLLSLWVPIPPLAEQLRIVQKFDQLMKDCDELELNIKQSVSQNEKLLQQVLREALRK